MIEPDTVSDWNAYYSSVKSLDDAVSSAMQKIEDTCSMITAFTDHTHYRIVSYFAIRWIGMRLKRERYRVDESLPFVYDILTAYAAEKAIDVSPKIAAGANEIMGAYENTVNKLHSYGAAATDDFYKLQESLAAKTLLWTVYTADSADSVVYLLLDDTHSLRFEYAGGKRSSKPASRKLSADRDKRSSVLRKEGEKLGKSVYVVENPAENVAVEMMLKGLEERLGGNE